MKVKNFSAAHRSRAQLSNDTTLQTAVYDCAGQRVQTTASGVTRTMVYDISGQLVADYRGHALERENIYRSGQLLATQEFSTPTQATEDIEWTNAVKVAVEGNKLTRTAADGWDGGAVSAKTIVSGDGYVEFTASAVSSLSNELFGLSHGDTDQSAADIDFAIYPSWDGNIYVWEGGSSRGVVGTYTGGDVLRVAVESGVVKYRKNGTLLYTSSGTPTYPLLADTCIYPQNGVLSNGKISGVLSYGAQPTGTQNIVWSNAVQVSVSGNTLTKTAADGWDAGAASTQTITSGDGYVEFTASTVSSLSNEMFGLSHGDTDQGAADIDFAVYPSWDGYVYVWEGGTSRGAVSSYTGGDVLRVAVESGVVKYRKNGSLIYTSSGTPSYPLLADCTIYPQNGVLSNGKISGNLNYPASAGPVKYVLQDVQGSTRAVMSGTQIVARHDYQPFGEELGAGIGLRGAGQGYGASDRNRQKYALTERDDVTGLDHTWFRKYESFSGRWISPDPLGGSMTIADPQSFNRYSYVQNDPVNFVDPSGLDGVLGGTMGLTLNPITGTVTIIIPGSQSITGSWLLGLGSHSLLMETPGETEGGDPTDPQNPGQTQPNPNCIMNAVSGATGLARPFGNVGADGSIGHDGIHVVAPPGSTVTTLGVLAGTVLGRPHAQGDGLFAVDVLVPGVGVAIYKDLGTVNVHNGQRLSAGTVIGTIGQGGDYAGLHFALLSGGKAADQYYRSLTSRAAAGDLNAQHQIKASMFINPNGPNSPVRCPGVPVNNAGVKPYP